MKRVLITGSAGFLGRNLAVALRRLQDVEVLEFDLDTPESRLPELAGLADAVVHLAGVNRPKEPGEFTAGNVGLTERLCQQLAATGRRVPLVLSSSVQAELDNPYGRSKRAAEEVVRDYRSRTGAPVRVYRLPNVFGKWSRPDYNTVVATFCHRISRGLPVQLNDRATPLRFVYVDDVVQEFSAAVTAPSFADAAGWAAVEPVHATTLGELHDLILSFQNTADRGWVPDLRDAFVRKLHATYLSFCEPAALSRSVEMKRDDRGWLFELVKSPAAGQMFVSRTRPGVTRGNHYHDTKVEKFCVIDGEGLIRLRPIQGEGLVEFRVSGADIRVVDIPPGCTHSIENIGPGDMLTLFWANEIFDPARPDTYALPVLAPCSSPGTQRNHP